MENVGLMNKARIMFIVRLVFDIEGVGRGLVYSAFAIGPLKLARPLP